MVAKCTPGETGANEGSRSHREHKSIRQDTPAILLCHAMVSPIAVTPTATSVAEPCLHPNRQGIAPLATRTPLWYNSIPEVSNAPSRPQLSGGIHKQPVARQSRSQQHHQE